KLRVERPCCQHVRHTDIRTDCAPPARCGCRPKQVGVAPTLSFFYPLDQFSTFRPGTADRSLSALTTVHPPRNLLPSNASCACRAACHSASSSGGICNGGMADLHYAPHNTPPFSTKTRVAAALIPAS